MKTPKELYNELQKMGIIKSSKTYEEHRKEYLGEVVQKTTENLNQESHQDWLNSLPEKEQKDFKFIFGDN